MGNSVGTLSNEQRIEIVKHMREKYESFHDLSDEDQQNKIVQFYNELIAKQKATADATAYAAKQDSVAENGKKKQEVKKPKKTRRRSFEKSGGLAYSLNAAKVKQRRAMEREQKEAANKANEVKAVTEMPVVEPEPEPEPEVAEVDTWESVRAQPSCMMCKMVFPTLSRLETHLKYSEVHAQNVKASHEAEEEAQRQKSISEDPSLLQEAASARCREVYSGSKLFWRDQESVEISIYLHIEQKCLEVIAFDYHSHTEYNRIYFNEEAIFEYITADVIKENVKVYKEKCMRRSGNEKGVPDLPPDKFLFDEERRVAVTSHIMAHLELAHSTDSHGKPRKVIGYEFRESFDNPSAATPLLSVTPEGVTPVLIPRRRLSTSAEIEKATSDIYDMNDALTASREKAEAVAAEMLQANEEIMKKSQSAPAGITLVAAES